MAAKLKKTAETERPDGVRVTTGKCPRCGQPVAPRFRPFCSERCSDLDLAGWLTGQYRLPTEEAADGGIRDTSAEDD